MIAGSAVVSWIILGSMSLPRVPDQYLPTTTSMCNNYTFSEVIMLRRNISSDTNELMSSVSENFSNSTQQESLAQFNANSSE